jgi:DNA invertase Pin-like site-specific DNA recombinase
VRSVNLANSAYIRPIHGGRAHVTHTIGAAARAVLSQFPKGTRSAYFEQLILTHPPVSPLSGTVQCLTDLPMGKRGNSKVAVAYLRASTSEQKLTPEAQRAAIDAWATREGVQIALWCVDQGVCSVTPLAERPALLEALRGIRTMGAGVLVVARRDRLARDVLLSGSISLATSKAGAGIVSAAGEGNGDGPADAFMRTVIDGAAEYERALIRSRTKAALAAKSARGERAGQVPFGYSCPDGVRLVPIAAEQATIARAIALRAEGMSLRAVSAQLASEGMLSRKGTIFAAEQVRSMLEVAAKYSRAA